MPLSRLGHVIMLWPILSYVFWFVISLFSVPEGDDLSVSRFRAFGPLRYARITLDPASGRSRGTGFACFWNKADADKVVEQSDLLRTETMGGDNVRLLVLVAHYDFDKHISLPSATQEKPVHLTVDSDS